MTSPASQSGKSGPVGARPLKPEPPDNLPLVGYYGYPRPGVIDQWIAETGGRPLDLDVDLGAPDTNLLPEAYCHILTNIVNNALNLRSQLSVIVASVGEEKCDGGRFLAELLSDLGFRVVETRFNRGAVPGKSVRIATSGLPLRRKVELIMDGVREPINVETTRVEPTHGFWGVPPHDMSLLELFPPGTHVYGWTRAAEAGRPWDLKLETQVDPDVPTVFYVQSFCAKGVLAKHLADKHRGLFIDCHGTAGRSVRAQIDAFLKLR